MESLRTTQQPLTVKEKGVLEFIEAYLQEKGGVAPSFQEIREHFGLASFNSVQRYLKQLQRKGYIHIPGGNQKRAITVLVGSPKPSLLNEGAVCTLPLLGRVAAGRPIEAFTHDESVEVPRGLVKHAGNTFALKVQGESMVEDGILDDDVILVERRERAQNGEIVVATVDQEATVKRIYWHEGSPPQVELRPANSNMKSMWYSPREVNIRGAVVGLLRKY